MMKNSIFEYDNYKQFALDWVKTKAQKGRGQLSRIAEHLNISSVSVSYIFSGERNLSEEQALELSEFLGLNEIESDYFLLLVQFARAGSKKLEQKYLKQISELKIKAQDLKARVPEHPEMDESAKARFYSNWYFSGIRLLSSIDGVDDIDSIVELLNLPKPRVREVLDFLLRYGLCIQKNGKLAMGPQRTHIDAKSALVAAHHRNWRLKAIENFDQIAEDELSFTGPMTLSRVAMREIRSELTELVARVAKLVEPSEAEVLSCINVDLFRIKKK